MNRGNRAASSSFDSRRGTSFVGWAIGKRDLRSDPTTGALAVIFDTTAIYIFVDSR